MKILIDMNLSPDWVREFELYEIEAVHWSTVGKFDAPDTMLMDWARKYDYIVFTHDLDFGTALALTLTKAQKSIIEFYPPRNLWRFLSTLLLPKPVSALLHLRQSGWQPKSNCRRQIVY